MGESNTLLKDDINYRLTLQTYLKYMQQLPPQRKWMENQLGPKLSELFARKREIRVLAVGTGSGEVDQDFLNEIVTRAKEQRGEDYHVIYQVIEPNPSSVEYFRNNVSKEANFKQVTFKWYMGFFEAFFEEFSREEKDKFDFAHFVRCFYHIDSRKGLDTTYNHFLAHDGIVAVVGENEDAFWPKQMKFLADHGMKHECFECSGAVSNAYFLPGWVSQAQSNGWKFETYIEKYNFNVSPMYDEASDVGNYLLDFAIHVKQSRKSVKKEILDDFFEFLNRYIKEVEVEEDGAKKTHKYFPCELGAIIITRK